MADWVHAQTDPGEELAQLHYFSFKKSEPGGEIDFVITVKEFASRNRLHMRFYAEADKEINQKTAAFHPLGRFTARRAQRMHSVHPPASVRAGITNKFIPRRARILLPRSISCPGNEPGDHTGGESPNVRHEGDAPFRRLYDRAHAAEQLHQEPDAEEEDRGDLDDVQEDDEEHHREDA